MVKNRGGTTIYSGASASLRGRSGFGTFNLSKGGLRGFAQALSKECRPLGVHVGHVIIDGAINGEVVNSRYPDYVEQIGGGSINKN